MNGVNVVGVQFRRAGKIYDFDAKDYDIKIGESVVVDTERGPSLAEVVKVKFVDRAEHGEAGLKAVVRKASDRDLDQSGKYSEDYAREFADKKVKELKLDMRVLKSEIQFGGSKVIIYFNAPGRVDFRELVKQLAGGLKARVELKQIGSRDETKIMGGVGICGREYCCSSFLREFIPVSIKMAKNQNLALNPTKVSGGCGRLLCCLTYENDLYTELRQKMPARGAPVELQDGSRGDVRTTDLLNQSARVELSDGQQVDVPISQLNVIKKPKKPAKKPEKEEWGEDINLEELMDD